MTKRDDAGDDEALTPMSKTALMQDFRKLRAWQASRELTVLIYRATRAFPDEERYGLTAQMRAAAVSIGANMAEGCGRHTRADTLRFFQISFGSAVELLHHVITAFDLGLLPKEDFDMLSAKLESQRRMTSALINRLREAAVR